LIGGSTLEPQVKETSLRIFQRRPRPKHGVTTRLSRRFIPRSRSGRFHRGHRGYAGGIAFFRSGKGFSSELPMGGVCELPARKASPAGPATVEVLKGYPVKKVEVEGELRNSTGASIVRRPQLRGCHLAEESSGRSATEWEEGEIPGPGRICCAWFSAKPRSGLNRTAP